MIDPDDDRAGFVCLDEVVRHVSELKGKPPHKAAAMLWLTIERNADWRALPMYVYSTTRGLTKAGDDARRNALNELQRVGDRGYHPLHEFDELPDVGYLQCDLLPLLHRTGRPSPVADFLSGSPDTLHAALSEALAVQRALEVRVHECMTRTKAAEGQAAEWKAAADKQLFLGERLSRQNEKLAEHLRAYKMDEAWLLDEERRLREWARQLEEREAAIEKLQARIADLEHELAETGADYMDREENPKAAGTKLRVIASLLNRLAAWPASGGQFRDMLNRGGHIFDEKTCRAILKAAADFKESSGNTD